MTLMWVSVGGQMRKVNRQRTTAQVDIGLDTGLSGSAGSRLWSHEAHAGVAG